MSKKEGKSSVSAAEEIHYAGDFSVKYANNVRFDMSAWDLKLIFGRLTKYDPPAIAEQHTAIVVPWLQAKIMALVLCIAVENHERMNGTVRIPKELLGTAIQSLGGRDITLEQMLSELAQNKDAIQRALQGGQ